MAGDPTGMRDRKTVNLVISLAERDGWDCCYCFASLNIETATIEHFVPVTSGGDSHMANLSLACRPCNQEAGHMPVRAKMEMAVRKRGRVGAAGEVVNG
jgi:5-methylcytosine-specific restriction endonuclease McrA